MRRPAEGLEDTHPHCPGENTLVGFARGALGEVARAGVETHLMGCGDCLHLVGMLASPAPDERGETPTGQIRGPQPGAASHEPRPRNDLLGRFLLLERLGAGGMGEVYAAYDPQLDRRVALKLLRPDFSAALGEVAHARLVREAQTMARLSHPNVVGVYEVGREAGQTWVAMELVVGQTLKGWLKAASRSWREVRAVFVAAGRGLAAAHAAGIVHRDYKPDNVLVGHDGRVRVGDFGLANPSMGASPPAPGAAADSPDAAPLTRTGLLVGTPGYLAPELLAGRPGDARSDQFSFAVSLWEAVYGTRPFAPTPTSSEPAHWRLAAPPGARRVPAWLHRVMARGLSVLPEARYPSLEALLEALSREPGGRRRRLASVGAALGLLGAGGVGYKALTPQPVPPCQGASARLAGGWDVERKRSIEEAFLATGHPGAGDAFARTAGVLDRYGRDWVSMHAEACEATRVRGEQSDEVLSLRMACLERRMTGLRALSDVLARPDRQVVVQAVSAAHALTELRGCADIAALRAPVPPPDDPVVRAWVEELRTRLAEAEAMKNASQFAQAQPLAKQVVEAAGPLGYRPLEGEALALLGHIEERLSHFDDAAELLQRAVFAAMAGGDTLTAARAAAVLGRVQCHRADYAGVRLWTDHARASLERAGGNDALEASVHAALACSANDRLRFAEAREHQQRALTLMERALGANNPGLIPYLNVLSYIHDGLGQMEQSLALVERSVALAQRALGPEHPSTAHAFYTLGGRLARLGRNDDAIAALERSVSLFEKSLGPDSASVAYSLVELGPVLSQRGDQARAASVLERSFTLFEKAYGAEHPTLAHGLWNWGMVRVRQGRAREALPRLERALTLVRKAFGEEHSRLAFPHLALGLAYQQLGRAGEARGAFEKAIALWRKAKDPNIGAGWEKLGEWHLAAGRPREALALFEQARASWDTEPGTADVSVVEALSGLGRAHLALGAPAAALPPLERAQLILERMKRPPEEVAQVHFALAQVLLKTGGKPERARALARSARDGYARSGHPKKAASVESWLARNPPDAVAAATR